MLTQIRCPHCGLAMTDDGSMAGQQVMCPGCRGHLVMPMAPEPPPPPPPVVIEQVQNLLPHYSTPVRTHRREPRHASPLTGPAVAIGILLLPLAGLAIWFAVQPKNRPQPSRSNVSRPKHDVPIESISVEMDAELSRLKQENNEFKDRLKQLEIDRQRTLNEEPVRPTVVVDEETNLATRSSRAREYRQRLEEMQGDYLAKVDQYVTDTERDQLRMEQIRYRLYNEDLTIFDQEGRRLYNEFQDIVRRIKTRNEEQNSEREAVEARIASLKREYSDVLDPPH
jgi:hypothetical protein